MAIAFARLEFVKRSDGKTAVGKSAYNGRDRLIFEGNCVIDPRIYDYTRKEEPTYHTILIPEGVDKNYLIPEVLWNAVEKKEKRSNAQVSMDLVLALPDDKEITVEDRIELTKSFVQKQYIDKGLAAQIDIHPPERTLVFLHTSEELGVTKGMKGNITNTSTEQLTVAIEKGGKKIKTLVFNPIEYPFFDVKESNWHAHIQLTTRRFKQNGKEFEETKARDLVPQIRNGKVISGPDWDKLWGEHQNAYFSAKGLALRVDPNGLIPQEHLGPVRMRTRNFERAYALTLRHQTRLELNALAAEDPKNILDAISKKQSIFTKEDVERFMQKHTPGDKIGEVRENFWKQDELVQLKSRETKEYVGKFTTKEVIAEEQQILRLADRIAERKIKGTKNESIRKAYASELTEEQKKAYYNILEGKGLTCIQGYAGTGKSHLLKALQAVYGEHISASIFNSQGAIVRAFAPDNATTLVLKEKGLLLTENIYKFLFASKHGRREISRNEVWILDEAGKLGNKPLLEFLKLADAKGAQVILAGDAAQLPSVERGGVFKMLCEKYGAQILEEIQRQRRNLHRSMAKDLATGDIGSALDKLVSTNGIKWSETRDQAMEDLILTWANDHRADRSSKVKTPDSSLIIAHTNEEVKVLNEMVRLIRKDRKEISGREFACETANGKIYISEGDRIQFRKNYPTLGVTNGMFGILMKAREDQFAVAVQENNKKTRIITFNPKEYHSFQLGYASTCNGAQGSTVERTYVMHSPYLNKQMAYVALTRHTEEVHYFVSKDEVTSLSDLKRQALRDNLKFTTLEYTHNEEIRQESLKEIREQEITNLKQAEKLGHRLKGTLLGSLTTLQGKAITLKSHFQDRKPSHEFYNPKIEKTSEYAEVREILPSDSSNVQEVTDERTPTKFQVKPTEAAQKIIPLTISQKVTNKDLLLENEEERNKMYNSKIECLKEHYENFRKEDLTKSIEKNKTFWNALSKEKKELVRNYYTSASKATDLKEVVAWETMGVKEIEKSSHFIEWQNACGERNEAAYALKMNLTKQEFLTIITEKTASFINVQSDRHGQILKIRQEKQMQFERGKDLEGQLRNNIEALLFKLFPDGPSSKTSREFRFGTKGSLSVKHTGENAGQYYDFENQQGGGPLKLIQRELKLDIKEAKDWSQSFLGIVKELSIPKTFIKPESNKLSMASDWVSIKPDPKIPAPKFEEISKLHHYYHEVSRHIYRDENGNPLYYVLRLQDKTDTSRKITPPLTYGYYKDEPNNLAWNLKGFKQDNNKNPLYNLHLLKEKLLSTILIVEGEKTADKALEKFPGRDLICITWSGGAGAVSKADWSPLTGREVIIWPDNDEAGLKAASDLCSELRKIGAHSIELVNPIELKKKIPEKWDLADPNPDEVDNRDLQKLLRSRIPKNVSPQKMVPSHATPIEKARASEILWHVDCALRPIFEKDNKLVPAEINREIFRVAKDKLLRLDAIEKRFKESPQICSKGELGKKLAYQALLFEIKNNKEPTLLEIDMMKSTIQAFQKQTPKDVQFSKEILNFAIDKTLEKICELTLSGKKTDYDFQFLTKEISNQSRGISTQLLHQSQVEQAKQEQQDVSKNKGIDLNL